MVLAGSFFCELQPFVVAGMFDIADGQVAGESPLGLGLVTSWVKTLATITTPIAAVLMFFASSSATSSKLPARPPG